MARPRTYVLKALMVCAIAGLSLISAATAVFAYPDVPASGSVVSTTCPAVIPQGTSCTIIVQVLDSMGNPVSGATVSYSGTLPPGGTITPNPSLTGADGKTTITYTAPAIGSTNCGPGTITGTATGGNPAGTATVKIPINVGCPASTGRLLPSASTETPSSGTPASQMALGAAAVAGLLIAVAGATRLRRSRRLTA